MNSSVSANRFVDIPGPASLADEITRLAGQINAGHFRLLELIAEFDRSKEWSGGGTVHSCAHWLNWRCGIALGAAREKVRVARCLEGLPQISASFAKGEVSYSMVRAMTRAAIPENEDYLLMIARHGTASHMEQLVSKYRKVRNVDDKELEKQWAKLRKLTCYQDDNEMWVIHARLPPEEGALVVKAIEALAAPIQQQRQAKIQERLAAEAQKEISAEISNEQAEAEKISAEIFEEQGPGSFTELIEHTRADALVKVAEHFLATCTGSGECEALKGSDRCQVVLHVDVNTLRKRSSGNSNDPPCCHLEEKPWISPDTARRLSCDASLVTALKDDKGRVLNIGRRSRTVPAKIRRALSIRDKTCCVPGCTESRYVDAHHIVHWADGGETSLDNLATLCRRHHRAIHRGVFSMRMQTSSSPDEHPEMIFETISGERLSTVFPQFPEQVAISGCEALALAAPDVDAKTCTPNWDGVRCDYGMAVDGLLRRQTG